MIYHPVTTKNEKAFVKTVKELQLNGEQSKAFTQHKRIAALKRPLVSKGTLVLSPKGICMATHSPFSSAVKITMDGIWQQTGERKARVQKSSDDFKIRHTAKILIALFTADKEALEKQFSLFYNQTEDGFQIGLRPRDRILAKIISNIVIDGSDGIHKIAIREASGDETTILISNTPPSKQITLETCIK